MTISHNTLTAVFEFHLPFPLQIHFPEPEVGPHQPEQRFIVGTPPQFTSSVDDSIITIEFILNYSPSHGFLGGYTPSAAYGLKLEISRAECEPLPNEKRSDFLNLRAEIYRKIAITALSRVFQFFKYRLYNPFIEMPNYGLFDREGEWRFNGSVIGKIPRVAVIGKLSGNAGQLSTEQLTLANAHEFKQALIQPAEVSITQEYLSEAHTAIIRRDFKKAVIDLAIACEVGIKTAFFQSEFSYEMLNALEDMGKIEVSPPDMINRIAMRVIGQKFKDPEYEDIVNLFRCRNKVAHRGELTFSIGNSGKKASVDIDLLEKWWFSTQALLEWLQTTVAPKAT